MIHYLIDVTLSAVGWLAGWWLGMGVCTRRAGTRTRRDKPVLYESVTQFHAIRNADFVQAS